MLAGKNQPQGYRGENISYEDKHTEKKHTEKKKK